MISVGEAVVPVRSVYIVGIYACSPSFPEPGEAVRIAQGRGFLSGCLVMVVWAGW